MPSRKATPEIALDRRSEFFAGFSQAIKSVHPRLVAIRPVELKGIPSDEANVAGTHGRIDLFTSDCSLAGVFIHAACAWAQISEFDVWNREAFSIRPHYPEGSARSWLNLGWKRSAHLVREDTPEPPRVIHC